MLPKPPPTIRHWLDSRLPRGNVVQEIEGEEGTFRVVPRKLEAQEPVDGRWMHVVNVEIPNLKAFLPRFIGLRGEVCFSSVVGAHTAFMGGGDFLAVVVDGPAQATFAKDVWSDFDPWTGRRFLTGRRPVPLAAPTGVQEAWVIPSETRLVGVLTNSQDYAKEAEEMDVSVFGSGSFGWWEPAEVPEPREWERAGRHPLGEGWEGMPPPKRAAIPAIRLPFYKISKDHKYIDKKKEDSGNFTYIYDKRHVAARNRKKEKRLQKLNRSLKEMRAKVKGDLSSDNETRRLAAIAVALIDETYERIGNEESASELKHYGVTGWLAKHVSFGKGRATIRYVGKAGVKQSKEVKEIGRAHV